MYFQIYEDKRGEWRWRLKAGNHQIIGGSGEGYTDKDHCKRMVENIRKNAGDADVMEVE